MYRSLVSCLLLTLAVSPASAQAPEEPRLGWEVRLLGFHFDNFFQAPEGVSEQDVEAARGEARASWRLRPGGATALFATAGVTAYGEDLEDSPALGVGLESRAGRREWLLELDHTRDQPVFDVGDELEQADTLRLTASYGYRVTESWEATVAGEWQRQDFEITSGKDNDLYSAGGAIRYRGWGYELSPEIGVDIGRRDADDPNEDHDQRDLWLKIRSVPVPPLYLSLRYRLRTREYTVDDPLAGNFGREDDRDYWTLNARYRLNEWTALDLYYNYLEADSDKQSRIFTTQILGLGVTFGRF